MMLMRLEYFYLRNQLAATFTVSAFTLIGPYVYYAGVHTQAEYVCQNCVRKVCVCLCLIIVLHLSFFLEFGLYCKIWMSILKVRDMGCFLLHSFGLGFRFYNNYYY